MTDVHSAESKSIDSMVVCSIEMKNLRSYRYRMRYSVSTCKAAMRQVCTRTKKLCCTFAHLIITPRTSGEPMEQPDRLIATHPKLSGSIASAGFSSNQSLNWKS